MKLLSWVTECSSYDRGNCGDSPTIKDIKMKSINEKWKKQIRIEYFRKYDGILPDKIISDSADWAIKFFEPVISQALSDERLRIEKWAKNNVYHATAFGDRKHREYVLLDDLLTEIKEVK